MITITVDEAALSAVLDAALKGQGLAVFEACGQIWNAVSMAKQPPTRADAIAKLEALRGGNG